MLFGIRCSPSRSSGYLQYMTCIYVVLDTVLILSVQLNLSKRRCHDMWWSPKSLVEGMTLAQNDSAYGCYRRPSVFSHSSIYASWGSSGCIHVILILLLVNVMLLGTADLEAAKLRNQPRKPTKNHRTTFALMSTKHIELHTRMDFPISYFLHIK